jgi:hypothetical protein
MVRVSIKYIIDVLCFLPSQEISVVRQTYSRWEFLSVVRRSHVRTLSVRSTVGPRPCNIDCILFVYDVLLMTLIIRLPLMHTSMYMYIFMFELQTTIDFKCAKLRYFCHNIRCESLESASRYFTYSVFLPFPGKCFRIGYVRVCVGYR